MAATDYLPVSDLTALDDVNQSDQMVVQVAGDNGDVMLVPFSTLVDKILDKLYARSESPAFTGSPTAPTPVKTDGTTVDTTESSTRIATTEYVQAVSSEITQAVSDETERAQSAETAILSNFATSEDTTTASSGYSVGDYLLLNKKLYVVTATIVSGDRLVEGTNISSVGIGSKFKTIDASLSSLTPVWKKQGESIGSKAVTVDETNLIVLYAIIKTPSGYTGMAIPPLSITGSNNVQNYYPSKNDGYWVVKRDSGSITITTAYNGTSNVLSSVHMWVYGLYSSK